MRVDPQTAVVRVDGQRVPTAAGTVVVAVDEPRGVLSTMSDDRGRPCLGDLVADRSERLFHVGRLDADTEGLILLTNDGELANRLAHPVVRRGQDLPGDRRRARAAWRGAPADDGHRAGGRPVRADSFKVVQSLPGQVLIEIVLHEGRNHIVRRMFEAVGHPVLSLVRTRIGPIVLGQQRRDGPGGRRCRGAGPLHRGGAVALPTQPAGDQVRHEHRRRRRRAVEQLHLGDPVPGRGAKSRSPQACPPVGAFPASPDPPRGPPRWIG